MVYLFYLALLSMATAIISVYPIFQEPNLVLGGSFAVIALIGFVIGDTSDYLLGRLGGRRAIAWLERYGLWRVREQHLRRALGALL
ncbi:MAG: hypothetical protein K6U74_16290, partial [Firmicutes bacterium]|nr:hypothetical protein [Bacillota bacterium]